MRKKEVLSDQHSKYLIINRKVFRPVLSRSAYGNYIQSQDTQLQVGQSVYCYEAVDGNALRIGSEVWYRHEPKRTANGALRHWDPYKAEASNVHALEPKVETNTSSEPMSDWVRFMVSA